MRLAPPAFAAAALLLAAVPGPAADPPSYPDRLDLLTYADGGGKMQPVRTSADWAKRRAHVLAGMELVMGPLPDAARKVPPDLKVEEEKDAGTHVRKKVSFAAEKVDRVCEHLPLVARQAHRLAVVRSVHHADPQHNNAGYRMLTGADPPLLENTVAALAKPKPDDHPPFGAVLTHLRQSAAPWVALPYEMVNGVPYPGQAAGFLGARHEPLWLKTDPSRGHDFAFRDLDLPADLPLPRVRQRGELLRSLDRTAGAAGHASADMTTYQARAADLLTSEATRRALQLDAEAPRARDRYGRNVFGQSCLLARRLVEAGTPLVAVYTHGQDGFRPGLSWDTHANNFRDLKDKILPIQDRGYAVLLEDLADRGLLDETLVVWMGEFGRTPKINANGGGRDHWPDVFTAVFAGGGVRGGITHGSSDRLGAYPASDPVAPQDVAATIYHCLGVDPKAVVRDRQGRPFEVALGGKPVGPLL